MIHQLKRGQSALNHQLLMSGIRVYAHERRLWHKQHAPLQNVTALRMLMKAQGFPLVPPKKPFSLARIEALMKRPPPWTLDQTKTALFQASKFSEEHQEIPFDVMCKGMQQYDFKVITWFARPGSGVLYRLYEKEALIGVMNAARVVSHFNQWRHGNNLRPLCVSGVTRG